MRETNQCPSCGGFCKKSGCERANIKPASAITRTELIANLKSCIELGASAATSYEYMEQAADMLEADGKYDQQAMELCEVCGWKAKMDGEPCLVCELPETGKLREAARLALKHLDEYINSGPRRLVIQAEMALKEALK